MINDDFLTFLNNLIGDPYSNVVNDPYAQQGLGRSLQGQARAQTIRDEDIARLLEYLRGIDIRNPLSPRTVASTFTDVNAPSIPSQRHATSNAAYPVNTYGISSSPVSPTRGVSQATINDPNAIFNTSIRPHKDPVFTHLDVGGIFPASLVDYLVQVNALGQGPRRIF